MQTQRKKGMQDPNCIFCKIIAGEISAKIIMQNEKAMALLDAFPLACDTKITLCQGAANE
jgi:hypothetical protein